MASKAHGLLAEIETDVLDDTVPLSSILRKVIILGGRAESQKMRDWARQELNGYNTEDVPEVPPYRQLHPPLYVRVTNTVGGNPREDLLPQELIHEGIQEYVNTTELLLDTGIGELEALVAAVAADPSKDPLRMSPYWGSALASWLDNHQVDKMSTRASAVYFKVQASTIVGVLSGIRTALAELVAELVAVTPEGDEVPQTADTDRIVQVVIFAGDNNTMSSTNQNSTSGSNISVPNADSAVVSTGSGTAIGNQTASGTGASLVGTQSASGENNSVAGGQSVQGDHATVAGRDLTHAPKEEPKGLWGRLRKRGLFVAIATVVAGLVAVFTWVGWTPWS